MGTTVPNGDQQVVALPFGDAFRCARVLQRHPPGTESGVMEELDVVVVVVVDDHEGGSDEDVVDDDGGSEDEEGSVDDDGTSVVDVDVDVDGVLDVAGVLVVDVVDVVDVDVEVVDEDVVARGPVATSLTGGERPPRADSMLGSSPSIPSAQLPVPPRLLEAANWAAS